MVFKCADFKCTSLNLHQLNHNNTPWTFDAVFSLVLLLHVLTNRIQLFGFDLALSIGSGGDSASAVTI